VTYDYSKADRLIHAVRGRVTQELKVVGSDSFKTQWGYNSNDSIAWMKYPADNAQGIGEQINFTYHPQGTLNTLANTTPYTFVQETKYNEAGQVELRTLGSNLLKTDYVYFGWGEAEGQRRLKRILSGTTANPSSLQDLRYYDTTTLAAWYDGVGNLLQIADYRAGPQTQAFTYDEADRILTAGASGGSSGNYSETYSYNSGTGNLAVKTGVSYTYGDANHKHAVTSFSNNTYAYDAVGNRLVAAVAASAGPNGCALAVVDPTSGNVEALSLLSSPPGRVFVSAAGRVAYVSLPQERALQQVLLGAGGGLGWRIDGLPRAVLDLAISPADAETIAFTIDSSTSLYLYRRGARVTAIGEFFPDVRYISSVAFTAADMLVATDHETTNNDLQRYRIDGNTLVETGRTTLPEVWRFTFACYLSGLMYTLRAWARLATAQPGGWILPPESIADLQQFGFLPPPSGYDSVALANDQGGGAMRAGLDGTLFFDRLASRAVSPLGGDLVGTRRLAVLDNGRAVPAAGTRFSTVMAGSGRWASLYTPPESTDATLYIVTGV